MTKYPEPFPKNHVIVLFDFAGTKKKIKESVTSVSSQNFSAW